jgi:hypothetical protein
MSFDAVLGLLAVVFFVVLPLISNASKRKPPEQGGPGAGGPQPGAPAPGEAAEQPTGWAAKLEEARRRIEAELSEAEAAARPARARPVTAPPAQSPQSQRATLRQAPRQAAQAGRPPVRSGPSQPTRIRQPAQATQAARVRQAAQGAESPADMSVASEELQVTRLDRPGTYNDAHSARKLPALTSRDSVLNGIIWHQILSEPPSRKRIRRQTSRPRSP